MLFASEGANEMDFQQDPCTPQNHTERLIRDLSRGCAFPEDVSQVDVRQTHISAVFLGPQVVYKVKKAIKLPFLDFSSLESRKYFCDEEVRINRAWAPDVYLGVVPVTESTDGLVFEGNGKTVDWAVKMRRLSESNTLRSRLTDGTLDATLLDRVARRVVAVHRVAPVATGVQAENAVKYFRRQFEDNWTFASGLQSSLIPPGVLARLMSLSNEWLTRHADLLGRRAVSGMIREVHGDLRLEHVFVYQEKSPPGDIVVLDGLEFDANLRWIDLIADIAFLTMELCFAGRRDLSQVFVNTYFADFSETNNRVLLPLFAAYRSAVRGKVAAILANDSEVAPDVQQKAIARSRAHWLWSLAELESPERRAAIVLVSGLPGTGKSTLAKTLAEDANFIVVRTDVVRKQIFAETENSKVLAGLYDPEKTKRVYDECLLQATKILADGGRVIIDATFQKDSDRHAFLRLAIDYGARGLWMECTAPPEITKHRLDNRHGDASDADWTVHQLVRSRWESPSESTQPFHVSIETSRSSREAALSAMSVLRSHELWGDLIYE